MASVKTLKAELLQLKLDHPAVRAEFVVAKEKLWQVEERIDRIEMELRVADLNKSPAKEDR